MIIPTWSKDAVFYHVYPLGLCGAPEHNDFSQPIEHRIERLYPWLDHIQYLGVNALYIGPLFQSSTHGYDTVDYYQIDRRLGDNDSFARFAEAVHRCGIRLVLDAVFNHVGRGFWAFKDVLKNGESSTYVDWFHNLRFGEDSAHGDPFTYEGWQGHTNLVKLNLENPDVRAHLFDAVGMWINKFGIDGLRLDAADCIDLAFLRDLKTFVRSHRSEFWLMGEVVFGDYRQWVNPVTLDSVTNYEAYKGLYSSLVESNYHEIAYALQRQFGAEGIYRDLWLYNFVDNHDVNRVASQLKNPALLYPLYLLLFTMPGIPSLYYGSEVGLEGVKGDWTDAPLRPALALGELQHNAPQMDLPSVIRRLIVLRSRLDALRYGDYQEMYVASQQIAFVRQFNGQQVIVVLNSDRQPATVNLSLPGLSGSFVDVLNGDEMVQTDQESLHLTLSPTWGRILVST